MSPTGPGREGGIVCKVGGSLLDAGRAPALVRVLARVAPRLRLLVLAGGGHAVDRLRVRYARGEIPEEDAHWAAVRRLDATALRLACGCGRTLHLTASLPRPGPGLSVLAPRALLAAEDPVPRSWDVTTDTIAAWCGRRLGASDVLLLKSRDAAPRPAGQRPPRRPVGPAAEEGLVDGHLPSLLGGRAGGPRVWIVNGRHPDRLLRWLTGDDAAATRLIPARDT